MSIQGDVHSTIDAATSLVNEKFGAVMSYADEAYERAKDLLSSLANVGLSSFTPTLPNINIPTDAPIQFTPVAPPQPDAFPSSPSDPIITTSSSPPVRPSIVMPPRPTMLEPSIPGEPVYSVPAFSAMVPPNTVRMPTINIEDGNTRYDSALLDALRAKLTNNIRFGGTGLPEDVEDAIYARDSERARLALDDEIDRFTDEWAKRGLPLPDGALAGGLRALHLDFTNKRLDVSRDIAIKQAELEQANMFKSIEEAIRMETVFIDFQKDVNQRVFLRSKALADSAIEVVKLEIANFNAKVDSYNKQGEVYKALLQGEAIKGDLYRSRMEAAKIVTGINQARADIYKTEVEGVRSVVEVYRADMEAFRISIEADRAIIDRYAALVHAYIGKCNAIVQKYNAQVEQYRAHFNNNTAYNDAVVKSLQTKVQAYAHIADMTVKAWEAAVRSHDVQYGIRVEAAKGGANVAAQIAAGALAAVGAQVHVTGSGSASEQYQEQLSMTSS